MARSVDLSSVGLYLTFFHQTHSAPALPPRLQVEMWICKVAWDANEDAHSGLAQEGKESSSRAPQGVGASFPRYNRAAVTPGATTVAL